MYLFYSLNQILCLLKPKRFSYKTKPNFFLSFIPFFVLCLLSNNNQKTVLKTAMEILKPSFLFHLFSINLLGLLLPLSLLLLARLSSALYLFGLLPLSSSLLLSLILYVNTPLLFLLVSFVTVSTLLHSLTGKSALPTKLPSPISRPRLYTAWIFLCTLQVY